MYNPRSFKVEDKQTLHQLMQDFSFGILFGPGASGPVATHLPFYLETDRGPQGTLVAHMARANPHWKSWDDSTELLIVFQGPHSYISPAWYEQQETVPTWNYASVHAYGRAKLVHEPELLKPMVLDLVDFNEASIGRPWDSSKMEKTLATELQAIVGFEIEIERLEGKFKFNQNRSLEDQQGVAQALETQGDTMAQAVAEIMSANIAKATT